MMHTFQQGGIYRHYKGNMYKALYVALHTETEEPLAIYQALYGDEKIWARPLEMFLDEEQKWEEKEKQKEQDR